MSLDVLLFWAGLAITVTGLVVFVMGRGKPAAEKQGDNRFEAFGIKVDVSNPSLLLVILGVVLMLVPKMVPQQATEPAEQLSVGLPLPDPTPSERPPDPIPPSTPEQTSQTDPVEEPPQEVRVIPTTVMARNAANRRAETEVGIAATTTLKKGELFPAAPPEKAAAAMAKAAKSRQPAPRASLRPPPKREAPTAVPEPVGDDDTARAGRSTESAPEPAAEASPRHLTVLARAEADSRAGITGETHDSFSRKLAREMTRQLTGRGVVVRQGEAKGMRALLRDDAGRMRLCRQTGSETLLVGDLSIPFAMGNIESAYWPDLGLYLIDCERGLIRGQRSTRLDPRHDDRFPFQVAITETVSGFLRDNRDLLRPLVR